MRTYRCSCSIYYEEVKFRRGKKLVGKVMLAKTVGIFISCIGSQNAVRLDSLSW